MPKLITKQEYEKEALQSDKPVIIEFFAEWCGKCQQMKPIFEEVEKEQGANYKFLIIDVDKSGDFVKELGISSVPTFLFMKDGKIKATEHGYMPKEDFIEKIKTHLS